MTKRMTFILGGVAGVLIVGVIVWLVASGRVALVWKQPQEKVVVDANVCNSEIIGRYNSLFLDPVSNVDEYAAKLKAVDNEIDGLSGADKDANCLYMRYTAALQAQDYDNAQGYIEKMKELVDGYHGQFVTAKVLRQFQPEMLEKWLEDVQAAAAQSGAQDSEAKEAVPSQGGQG